MSVFCATSMGPIYDMGQFKMFPSSSHMHNIQTMPCHLSLVMRFLPQDLWYRHHICNSTCFIACAFARVSPICSAQLASWCIRPMSLAMHPCIDIANQVSICCLQLMAACLKLPGLHNAHLSRLVRFHMGPRGKAASRCSSKSYVEVAIISRLVSCVILPTCSRCCSKQRCKARSLS